MKYTVLFVVLLCQLNSFAGEIVSILDFGANIGSDNNAAAIQKAIDHCAAAGGGIVNVPPGIFISGTVFLRSHVNFHLAAGAVIKGSLRHPQDYPGRGLIVAENIENAAISGQGTLDGQGDHKNFQYGDNKGNRPHVILFSQCKNMTVNGISLINSAWWTLRLAFCNGIKIDGIRIHCQGNYNNDGIDIDSKNVLISNSIIDCDDDAVCFKTDRPDFDVEQVVITNCILSSNCNAIKFGTASHAGFKNITISNCVIHKASENNIRHWKTMRGVAADTTVLSGIALEVVDGGYMDQVTISNISMQDVQTPVFVRLGSRKTAGTLKNIIISNIVAYNKSMMTSSITGIPDHRVENITLRDMTFYYTGGGIADDATMIVPENEKAYPEQRMFGFALPAFGLYVRHVQNMTIENFQCYTLQPDARPAFIFDDVHNLLLNNFQTSGPSGSQPLIRLIQTSKVIISGYRGDSQLPSFLKVEGEKTNSITLFQNDFSQVGRVLNKGSEISKKEIKIK